jgi:predicted transcriptional regulator
MFEVFVKKKPCRILCRLKDTETSWYLSKIAKETDTTYVYVTKLVSRLEKEGYLIIESRGKKRIVKLTEKGAHVANAINELESRFEDES